MIIADAKNGGMMDKYPYQLNAYYPLVKENNKNVSFKEDGHIYKNENGIQVPSFSQVMNFVKKTYKDDTVQMGMYRGSYIHEKIAMINRGETVDIDSLIDGSTSGTKDTRGPVMGWIKFLNENNLRNEKCIVEQPYISKLGYTGTPDVIYPDYPGKDQLWIVFLKDSGDYEIKKVKIDKSKFNEFRCAVVAYNLSKKL